MKTKNFLLTGALLIMALFSVNGVMAQGPAETGTTKVTIKLRPMQAITVNQSNVLLDYATIEDYSTGVTTEMTSHLTVYSVGGYVVRVESDGDFERVGGGTISAGDIKLKATSAALSPGNMPEVDLSVNPTALITSNIGGLNKKYNVTYNNHLGKDFAYAGKGAGEYIATVIYTIAAQ